MKIWQALQQFKAIGNLKSSSVKAVGNSIIAVRVSTDPRVSIATGTTQLGERQAQLNQHSEEGI